MREFKKTFQKEISIGLRNYGDTSGVGAGLTECYNIRPDERGLIPIEPLTIQLAGQTFSWPFPQIFIGPLYRVMCTSDEVYSLDSSFVPTVEITGITGDDYWHLADFQGFFIGTNGTNIIYLDYGTISAAIIPPNWVVGTEISNSEKVVPGCKSYCNYKGQLIGGNVFSSFYDLGNNDVIWSNIGDIDCTPGLQNEASNMKMPWEGDIHRVLRLDEIIMVYGADGIASLFPSERYLGLKEFASIPGIPGRGCTFGTKDKHLLVDNEGILWHITSQGVNKLGYQEFIKTMTLADISISYNINRDEFYVSDGTKNFMLNKYGFCETKQFPSSVFSEGSVSYGTLIEEAGLDKDEARVASNTLDLGLAGQKTITSVEYGLHDTTGNHQGAVEKRFKISDPFTTSPLKRINHEGVYFGPQAGIELRSVIHGDDFTNFFLDYISVKYKVTDKRYLRGAYASDADKVNA